MNSADHIRVLSAVPYILAALLAFFLIRWQRGPDLQLTLRIPDPVHAQRRAQQADNEASRVLAGPADLCGSFRRFDGVPSKTITGTWSAFRGNARENLYSGKPIAKTLAGPAVRLMWEVPLGEGYAGAVIALGCAYVLDYDPENREEQIRCFSMDDGKEIWRRSYRVTIKRNHGFSRTVPAVYGSNVVTIGAKGHVMCHNALTGAFHWSIDLERDYGAVIPLWYTGQCPLIDNGTVIIAAGGKALLFGVDIHTGKVLWETPNPKKYLMSHSSVMPVTVHGKPAYAYTALGGFVGIGLRGTIEWDSELWKPTVIAPSPVLFSEGKFLVTAGYGAGSAILKINADFSVSKESIFSRSHFACEQHTPLFYKNHFYTVNPSDGGASRRQLVCMDTKGTIKWTSGAYRFGLGPFLIMNDVVLVLDDTGLLTMIKADSEKFDMKGQVQVLSGRESWGPMAAADGRLIVRDFTMMRCYDLSEK